MSDPANSTPAEPSFPAAVKDDRTLCPMVDQKPHVGGSLTPVAVPAPLYEDVEVIRLGDMASCPGVSDVVMEGAATVLANGLPVARVTGKTAHGGVILGPGCASILIGGPMFSLPPNMSIQGPPDFQNKVIRDLFLLSTTPSGKELFRQIALTDQPIRIRPADSALGPYDENRAVPDDEGARARGEPTGTTIYYNPDSDLLAYSEGSPKYTQTSHPPQVILAHEMIHAKNNAAAEGVVDDPSCSLPEAGGGPTKPFERRGIGLDDHAADYPTENSFREDLGLPKRSDHLVSDRKGDTVVGEPPPRIDLRPGY